MGGTDTDSCIDLTVKFDSSDGPGATQLLRSLVALLLAQGLPPRHSHLYGEVVYQSRTICDVLESIIAEDELAGTHEIISAIKTLERVLLSIYLADFQQCSEMIPPSSDIISGIIFMKRWAEERDMLFKYFVELKSIASHIPSRYWEIPSSESIELSRAQDDVIILSTLATYIVSDVLTVGQGSMFDINKQAVEEIKSIIGRVTDEASTKQSITVVSQDFFLGIIKAVMLISIPFVILEGGNGQNEGTVEYLRSATVWDVSRNLSKDLMDYVNTLDSPQVENLQDLEARISHCEKILLKCRATADNNKTENLINQVAAIRVRYHRRALVLIRSVASLDEMFHDTTVPDTLSRIEGLLKEIEVPIREGLRVTRAGILSGSDDYDSRLDRLWRRISSILQRPFVSNNLDPKYKDDFKQAVSFDEIQSQALALGPSETKKLQAQIQTIISGVVVDDEQRNSIIKLRGEDSQCIINVVDDILHETDTLRLDIRRRVLALLCQLAESARVFPWCYKLDDTELSWGNVAWTDPSLGWYRHHKIRVEVPSTSKGLEDLYCGDTIRELVLWAHLSHPNILPFSGVYMDCCLVSPWIENGDLLEYLQQDHHDSLGLRMLLISDIADGLCYLHSIGVVHGDLEGENISISGDGRALISNFSVSRTIMDMSRSAWMSCLSPPEVFLTYNIAIPPLLASDIWSFGCLCYEIFTRRIIFYEEPSTVMGILAILGRRVPLRPPPDSPDRPDDAVWDIMLKCWKYAPEERPTCEELLLFFEGMKPPDHRPWDQSRAGDSHAYWKDELGEKLNYARAYQILV